VKLLCKENGLWYFSFSLRSLRFFRLLSASSLSRKPAEISTVIFLVGLFNRDISSCKILTVVEDLASMDAEHSTWH